MRFGEGVYFMCEWKFLDDRISDDGKKKVKALQTVSRGWLALAFNPWW